MTEAVELGPQTGDAALARCIPCSAEEFGATYWDRAPLLTKATQLPRDFTDLLSPAAVDELIATHGLRTPFVRMAKDGSDLKNADFTRGGGAGAGSADQVGDDKVLSAMAAGTTLVLLAVHRTWAPMMHFAHQLRMELGHPVQVNAYITPPQNQGFAPHYDTHDVFVLQVAGRKRWLIHEPVVPSALETQSYYRRKHAVNARAAEEPLIDAVLEPGDAMYLPRGAIHSATALGETSIHITVGVHPITRSHLARYLLDVADEEQDMRASLPIGRDLTDPAVLTEHLAETIDALSRRLAEADAAPVARRLGDDLRSRTRPEPVGPLAQLEAAAALTPGTPVRLRSGLHPRLEELADELRIHLVDRFVNLRPAALGAVKVLLTGEPVTAADLPGLHPDAQLTLLQGLLRQGVIVPA